MTQKLIWMSQIYVHYEYETLTWLWTNFLSFAYTMSTATFHISKNLQWRDLYVKNKIWFKNK